MFDFYLRTIQKLEIDVAASKKNEYRIMLLNTEMKLPVDVVTDKGKQRIILGKEPITIKSTTTPQIDPDDYYLKRVIFE